MTSVRIGDVTERVDTWNPQASAAREIIRYIDISSIDATKKTIPAPVLVSAADAPSRARQLVREGDVLVSTVRPGLNAVARVPSALDGATASTGFCVLRPNWSRLESGYLFHWVRSSTFVRHLESRATGASYPAVTDRVILESKLPLPPLPEQRRIAELLDQADAVRRKREEGRCLVDELLRSVFLEMFGDPVRNERGWEAAPLGELARIRRGASPRPIEQFMGGTVPWIKIGDATGSSSLYIEQTRDFVTEEGARRSVRLEPGAVIVANSGVSLGFARILRIGGCIHDGWLSVEQVREALTPIFFVSLINMCTERLRALAPKGTQPNLNIGLLSAFQVILPPVELQLRFEAVAQRLERLALRMNPDERLGSALCGLLAHGATASMP